MVEPLVLIVEDDPSQLEVLSHGVQMSGYRVISVSDGQAALTAFDEQEPDIVLLDWMLPAQSGIEVCKAIKARRKGPKVPVIIISARIEEDDLIKGLDTGADDYVCKPYSIAELLARMKAQLRRSNPALAAETLRYQDIVMKTEQHRVYRAGEPIKLAPTEYKILATMLRAPGRVWSREQLLDAAWGRDIYVEDRTVDVHIGRLRKALMRFGGSDLIRTVRGTGYSLG